MISGLIIGGIGFLVAIVLGWYLIGRFFFEKAKEASREKQEKQEQEMRQLTRERLQARERHEANPR
jgi:uncharacterized membrane protein YciS (DUF1049 family)